MQWNQLFQITSALLAMCAPPPSEYNRIESMKIFAKGLIVQRLRSNGDYVVWGWATHSTINIKDNSLNMYYLGSPRIWQSIREDMTQVQKI